jgi:hypothetical protein
MPTQNESMNMREKIYEHVLPLHHDHDWCCLVTNVYTKLNHEHEHDQEKFWALASVWLPHHDDDSMLLSVYTKWESRLAKNMIKRNGLLLVGLRPIRKNEIDYSSCTTWKS